MVLLLKFLNSAAIDSKYSVICCAIEAVSILEIQKFWIIYKHMKIDSPR